MTRERDPSPKGKEPGRSRPRAIDNWRGLGSYGTLGLDIALSIALGFFAGRWLDSRLGTDPWLSIFGFICGVGAAIKAVMRAMRGMAADAAREEREQGSPAPVYEKPDDKPDDKPEDKTEAKPDKGDGKGEG